MYMPQNEQINQCSKVLYHFVIQEKNIDNSMKTRPKLQKISFSHLFASIILK